MIDQDSHQGFYLIYRPVKTFDEQWEETRCTNSECERHNSEQDGEWNFCPTCGSKIDWLPVTVTHKLDFDKFSNKYHDVKFIDINFIDWLWNPPYITKLINKDFETFENEKGTEVILPNRHSLGEFKDENNFLKHPAVKFMLDKLGEENFTLHYGLVNYEY